MATTGGEIDLGQSCGGHIDPGNLTTIGYVAVDGSNSGTVKGYICPLGQVCKEKGGNPNDNVESFDSIFYATLQVIIVASANGVRFVSFFFFLVFVCVAHI